jgi:hypothetical protein
MILAAVNIRMHKVLVASLRWGINSRFAICELRIREFSTKPGEPDGNTGKGLV